MSANRGRVIGVNGAMVTVEFESTVMQNEVAWVSVEDVELPAEVIRVRGRYADLQVFEDTSGLTVGGSGEFRRTHAVGGAWSRPPLADL